MTEKAVLVVSFGTTHLDTLEKTIQPIEWDIAGRMPGRVQRRAFTSGMILRRLSERGLDIDDVPRALERLAGEGCTDVVLQPTHIMNGDEYDKMMALAAPFEGRFEKLAFGRPLLTETGDYLDAVQALLHDLPEREEGKAILYMGHGTEHFANSCYALLEYVFRDLGRKDVVIGTVEGYPGFGEAVRRIKELGATEVELRPLMIVAGDHAKNDLAGEEEDSWKSLLEQEGYAVNCVLQGLGEFPSIQALFVKHAKEGEQLQA